MTVSVKSKAWKQADGEYGGIEEERTGIRLKDKKAEGWTGAQYRACVQGHHGREAWNASSVQVRLIVNAALIPRITNFLM